MPLPALTQLTMEAWTSNGQAYGPYTLTWKEHPYETETWQEFRRRFADFVDDQYTAHPPSTP